ncbi:MAG: hypothetical protein LBQ47_06170, partial [Endomicrobium sp.]|nr:hypothetical protein [Endomicrobium sp.]
MEIRTIVASAVIFVAVYAACAANAAPNDNFSALAFAANSCGAEFYKIIDDDNKNENVLFSPFAVFALCAALFEGSSGKTSGDYLNAFDFAADADKRKTMFSRRLKPYTNSKRAINLKNSIWVSSKNKLLKRYKNDASDYYYIGVYEDINFGLPQSA